MQLHLQQYQVLFLALRKTENVAKWRDFCMGSAVEAYELFAFFWHNYYRHRASQGANSIEKKADLVPLFGIAPDDSKGRRTFSTYLSKWLREGLQEPQVSGKIKERFARQSFKTDLATAIAIPPEALEATTLAEFISILDAAGIRPDKDHLPPPLVASSVTAAEAPADLVLCAEERTALNYVANQIVQAKSTITEWIAPFQSGASFVVDQLCHSDIISQFYASVFHIYFDPCETDGRSELRELMRHLDLNPDSKGAESKLVTALVEKRCLVVLHGASYTTTKFVGNKSPILQFIRTVRQKRAFANQAILLLLSASQVATSNPEQQALAASDLLRVESGHRFAFFRVELNRFLSLRGNEGQLHDADARLKQARWHYDQVEDVEIWPASIRLRAFFASNMANESYFDPTQGFERLAGSIDLERCPDIRSLVREAVTYFNVLRKEAGDKDRPGPRFLTWCTTTLYWLTDEAIKYIQSKGKEKIQTLKVDQCHGFAAEVLYDSLVRFNRSEGDSMNYAMTLGVKAVIQDIWMQSGDDARYNRATVHYYTAKRMFELRDGLSLSQELPYVKGRADDDIFFLPEVIRHLMRACGAKVSRSRKKLIPLSTDFDDHDLKTFSVKEPVRGKAQGCDPQDAWRFCYWVVFRKILNGRGRQLTRRFGAYQLKLEVLQLLCGDGDFNQAHTGMPPCDAPFFLNDLACALLDVGRADEAAVVFARLSKLADETDDHATHCKSLINEAMVAGVMGEFEKALDLAESAQSLISEGKIDGKESEKLAERLQSRRAHIAYLSGDNDLAIKLYRKLEREDLRPTIRRDRALPYIRSLVARSENTTADRQSDLSKAISVCISNMIRSTTVSNFHEVLGFEIAMAELFRCQGFQEPAESCLDQVYLDILNHGCSERTYLNFLIEAGEVLLGRENYARAYAAYLHPALMRLRTRPLAHERNRAKRLSLNILDMLEGQRRECSGDSAWSKYLVSALTTPEFLEAAVSPQHSDEGRSPTVRIHGMNPHFSFDLIGVMEWSKRLETVDRVQKERDFVTTLPWD